MSKYYKLRDMEHKGIVVRTEGRKHYVYKDGEWVRTGIMMLYFNPDAPEYECYDEISEKEANQTLSI